MTKQGKTKESKKDFNREDTIELLTMLRNNFRAISKYFRDTVAINTNYKKLRNCMSLALMSVDMIKIFVKRNK